MMTMGLVTLRCVCWGSQTRHNSLLYEMRVVPQLLHNVPWKWGDLARHSLVFCGLVSCSVLFFALVSFVFIQVECTMSGDQLNGRRNCTRDMHRSSDHDNRRLERMGEKLSGNVNQTGVDA